MIQENYSNNAQQYALDLYRKQNYRDALTVFDQGFRTNANNPWYIHDRARTLLEIGGTRTIDGFFDIYSLFRKLPNDPQINVSLAIAYGKIWDYKNAGKYFERAYKLDPNNYEAKLFGPLNVNPSERARRLHEEGLKHLQANNPREALRYYEAALAVGGEEAAAWSLHDKGIALMRLGQYNDAIMALALSARFIKGSPSVDKDIEEAMERKSAFSAKRKRKFHETEQILYKQQYGAHRNRPLFEGRRVESCVIASPIVALMRMGVIPTDENRMHQLEDELLRSVIQKGYVGQDGSMSIDVANRIFQTFGLASGYARNQKEMIAALKAGGCVLQCDGHMRCITELSEDGKSFKIFDPLYDDYSRIWGINRLPKGNTIVVYPNEYKPGSLSSHETFETRSYAIPSNLIDNAYNYSIY